MEERLMQPVIDDDWAQSLAQTLQEHRQRANSLVRAHRQRVQDVQAELGQQIKELSEQLSHAQAQAAEQERVLQDAAARLQEENAELRSQLAERAAQLDEKSNAELAKVCEQRDQLARQLDELQTQLQQGAARDTNQEVRELRDRLELAVSDIHSLRNENQQLQEKLNAGHREPAPDEAAEDGTDWESQKRRMLAQLESDFDESDPQQSRERLKVEEVIRQTEQAVARKDSELEQMRRQLEQLAAGDDDRAENPAHEALDLDQAVETERERLKALQEEWQNKLREAEVAISVERAKLARDRAGLEEKVQFLELQVAEKSEGGGGGGGPGAGKQSSRGRWLARLGLADDQ